MDQEITASGVEPEPRPQFQDGYCSVGVCSQEFNNDGTETNNPPKDVCLCLICYVKFNPEPCPQLSTSTPVFDNDFGNQPATPFMPPVSNVNTKVNSTSKELFEIFCRYMNLPSSSSLLDSVIRDLTLELMDSPFCNSCASSLQDLLDYHEHIQKLVILTKQITAKLTMKIVESSGRNMKIKEGQRNSNSHSSVPKDEEQSANVDINDEMNDNRTKICRTDQSALTDKLYENYIADDSHSLSPFLGSFQETDPRDSSLINLVAEAEKNVYVGREQTLWGKMDTLRQFIYDRYDVKVHVSRLRNETQRQVFDSDSDGSGNIFVSNDSDEHIIEYASDLSELSDINIIIPIVEYGPSTSNSPSVHCSPSLSQATFPKNDEDKEIQVDSNSHDLNPTDLMEFPSDSRSTVVSATRMTRGTRRKVTMKLEPPPSLASNKTEDEDHYEKDGKNSYEKRKKSRYAQRYSNLGCKEVSPGEFLYADKVRFLQMKDGYRCGTCFVKKTTKLEIMGHCFSSHCRNRKQCAKQINRLVEISANMFLYANKYFVKKVKNSFKCCLCGKRLGKYKLLEHIRETHIRDDIRGNSSLVEPENFNVTAKRKMKREIKSEANVEIDAKSIRNSCAKASAFEMPTVSKMHDSSEINMLHEIEDEMIENDKERNSNSNSLDSNNPMPQNPSFDISDLVPIPIPLPESRSCDVDPSEETDSDSDTEVNQGGKKCVEIEPNKFLYAQKYIFEKIGKGYKCHTCGYHHTDIKRMRAHLKKTHIYVRKTSRVNYKWKEVGPDKYEYAYKYIVERIGENRYKCCTCEHTAKGKVKICEHLRTTHMNSGQKYMCETCGKNFIKIDSFWKHRRLHKSVSLYACETCGRTFEQQAYLTRHLLTHMGDDVKNFVCEYCGKKFRTKMKLIGHTSVHTGEKAFQCSVCPMRFTTYNSMSYHRVNVHGRVASKF